MWSCDAAFWIVKTRLLLCFVELLYGSVWFMMNTCFEWGTGEASSANAALDAGSLAAACSSKKLT